MDRFTNQDISIGLLIENIEKVIIGKRDTIELIITALLAKGHVLIEDVPGVGKTQLVASVAKSCEGIFNRIQLTPDVMPSDVTGFNFLNQVDKKMEFRPGAAFCHFLLADEINRCSPKTQSALLEIMEEGQASIDGTTYLLPKPFMVLATQNPVETSGTYHLPEAQMDRFMMRVSIGYPEFEDEIAMFHRENGGASGLKSVVTLEDINRLIAMADAVTCTEAVERYIVAIANASRNSEEFELGVSPRGCIAIRNAAKAYAFVKGRNYVVPDDIKKLAVPVLAHRVMLSAKGKSMWQTGDRAIEHLIETVNVVEN